MSTDANADLSAQGVRWPTSLVQQRKPWRVNGPSPKDPRRNLVWKIKRPPCAELIMLPDAFPQLIDMLLRLPHIEAAQLRELIQHVLDPQAAAQEMVRRGWITQNQFSSLFSDPQQRPTPQETMLVGLGDEESPPDADCDDWSLPPKGLRKNNMVNFPAAPVAPASRRCWNSHRRDAGATGDMPLSLTKLLLREPLASRPPLYSCIGLCMRS